MTLQTDLLALERKFWTGDAEFYRGHLADECLVAFPDMAGVMSKDQVADMVKKDGPRWSEVNMRDKGLVEPVPGMAMLSYEASAKRGGDGERYNALVSSAYVKKNGEWKLAFHQQTPLGKPS